MSDISRRSFVNGTLMAAGGSMLPFEANRQVAMTAPDPSDYPPACPAPGKSPGFYVDTTDG